MHIKILLSAFFCFSVCISSYSQRVVAVQTVDFERSRLWYSCNYTHRAPDRDSKSPRLVKQSEKAFEGISKELTVPLKRNSCHRFVFFAKRDSQYIFNRPEAKTEKQHLRLLIFGAQAHCGYEELLAEPIEISSPRWRKYSVTLKGDIKSWTHINIYCVSENAEASKSIILLNQQGEIEEINCPPRGVSVVENENIVNNYFRYNPASTLSFGGILMLYEISPQSLEVFRNNGDIIQEEKIRKDLARNANLDAVLNEFRGIDYMFLVLNKKKYRKKRLNLISYLKTKYPDIFKQSKIFLYDELPEYKLRANKPKGDLLVVESVRQET